MSKPKFTGETARQLRDKRKSKRGWPRKAAPRGHAVMPRSCDAPSQKGAGDALVAGWRGVFSGV